MCYVWGQVRRTALSPLWFNVKQALRQTNSDLQYLWMILAVLDNIILFYFLLSQMCFYYPGAVVWNSLHHFLHLSHTLPVFVQKALLHLILSPFTSFFVSLIHRFSHCKWQKVGRGLRTKICPWRIWSPWCMYRVMLTPKGLPMRHIEGLGV